MKLYMYCFSLTQPNCLSSFISGRKEKDRVNTIYSNYLFWLSPGILIDPKGSLIGNDFWEPHTMALMTQRLLTMLPSDPANFSTLFYTHYIRVQS